MISLSRLSSQSILFRPSAQHVDPLADLTVSGKDETNLAERRPLEEPFGWHVVTDVAGSVVVTAAASVRATITVTVWAITSCRSLRMLARSAATAARRRSGSKVTTR